MVAGLDKPHTILQLCAHCRIQHVLFRLSAVVLTRAFSLTKLDVFNWDSAVTSRIKHVIIGMLEVVVALSSVTEYAVGAARTSKSMGGLDILSPLVSAVAAFVIPPIRSICYTYAKHGVAFYDGPCINLPKATTRPYEDWRDDFAMPMLLAPTDLSWPGRAHEHA